MVSLASSFVAPIVNCNEVVGSGSCLLVSNIENCGDEPILYNITNTAAIAAAATTATLSVVSATQDGVAVTPAPTSVVLREGSRLYFTPTSFITIKNETTVGTATVVDIEPATAAIASAGTALTWAMQLLDTVSDLPIDLASTTSDRKDLKSGLQGSTIKNRIDLTIALTYFASPLDKTQQEVMLKAALSTNNVYFVAVKSTGLIAFGKAQINGLSETGTTEIVTYSTTLNAQSPWAVTFRTANPAVNPVAQLADLNTVNRYSGLPLV